MSTLAIMTRDELILITGYRQKAKQAAFLKAARITHKLNAFGFPVVGRAYWEQLQGAQKRRNNAAPTWVETNAHQES
jgi:hypothetical protein